MPAVLSVLILGVAAGLLALLPRTRCEDAAAITALAALLAPLPIVIGATASPVGFFLEHDFGTWVPGVHLVARVTPATFTLVMVICVALLLSAAQTRRLPAARAGEMVGAAGAVVAACGGNAVLLAAGIDIVTVGAFLAAAGTTGRAGRGAAAAFAAGIAAASLLLLAAVQLLAHEATSDYSVLPAGALTGGVTVPWVLAACMCLGSPLLTPSAVDRRFTLTWATAGALPAGVAVLLHLQDAVGDPTVTGATILAALLGSLLGIGGGIGALHARRDPARVVRWLLVAAAGPLLAITPLVATGRLGAGMAGFSLLIWGVAGATWLQRPVRRSPAAAGLLLVAGGFSLDAAAVCSGIAAAGGGAGWTIVAVAIPAGAVISLLATALALRAVPGAGGQETRAARGAAVMVMLGAAVVSLLPGSVVTLTGAVLGIPQNPAGPLVAGAGALGNWPGGYLVAAACLAAAGMWSLRTLLGRAAPAGARPVRRGSRAPWLASLHLRRRTLPLTHRSLAALRGLDTWLTRQPSFAIAVLASALAVILIR